MSNSPDFYRKLLIQALDNQEVNPGMSIEIAATHAVLDALDISNLSTAEDHQIAEYCIEEVVNLNERGDNMILRTLQ